MVVFPSFIYLNHSFFNVLFCLNVSLSLNSCILLGGLNYVVNIGKMFGVDEEATKLKI
jgi:hypothetical protein